MYSINGVPNGKVHVGSRSTPFEYAITLTPVAETITVTMTPTRVEKTQTATASQYDAEVLCRLP
jgi:hypothetical protein